LKKKRGIKLKWKENSKGGFGGAHKNVGGGEGNFKKTSWVTRVSRKRKRKKEEEDFCKCQNTEGVIEGGGGTRREKEGGKKGWGFCASGPYKVGGVYRKKKKRGGKRKNGQKRKKNPRKNTETVWNFGGKT